MVVDREGKIFENRRQKEERRKCNSKVENDRRKSTRRDENDKANNKK